MNRLNQNSINCRKILKSDIGWDKHKKPTEIFSAAAEGRRKDIWESL